jgi:hypothetical protein
LDEVIFNYLLIFEIKYLIQEFYFQLKAST